MARKSALHQVYVHDLQWKMPPWAARSMPYTCYKTPYKAVNVINSSLDTQVHLLEKFMEPLGSWLIWESPKSGMVGTHIKPHNW